MTRRHLQSLARGRMRYTGETYQQALDAAERLWGSAAVIPAAHNDTQRQLECAAMSALLAAATTHGSGDSLPVHAVRPFAEHLEMSLAADGVETLCAVLFRDLLQYGIAGGPSFTMRACGAGVEILGAAGAARLLLRKVPLSAFRSSVDRAVAMGPVPLPVDPGLSDLLRRVAVLRTAEDVMWAAERRDRPAPAEAGRLLASPIFGLPLGEKTPETRRKRIFALLVGVETINGHRLSGCRNDIENVAAYLRERYSGAELQIQVLLDVDATRAAVIDGLRGHLAGAGREDAALFWFSGHGQRAGLTGSGLATSVLATADGSWEKPSGLHGPELVAMLNEVADRAGHVVAVVDTCHAAGTVGAEPPMPIADPAAFRGPWLPLSGSLPEAADPARFVSLSASDSEGLAHELVRDGVPQGAFSAELLAALQALGPGATYRELMSAVSMAYVPRQNPVLWPPDPAIIDQPFLGGKPRRPVTGITLRHSVDGWVVDAGACHGLTADATLAVAGTGQAIEVIRVSAGAALVQPVDWEPQHGAQYQVEPVTMAKSATEVTVEGEEEFAGAIRAAIETAGPYLTLAEDADLRVVATAGSIAIRHGTETVAEPAGGPGAAARAVRMLVRLARWQQLFELGNLATGIGDAVRLEIAGPGGEPARPDPDGVLRLAYHRSTPPELLFRLHNTADRRLYCALLGLTDTFGAHTTLLHGAWLAPSGAGVAGRGRPVAITPSQQVPRGDSFTTWIKLVVSTEPFAVTRYDLPRRLEGRRRSRRNVAFPSPRRPASDILLGSRDVAAPEERWREDSDWSTTTVRVDVRR